MIAHQHPRMDLPAMASAHSLQPAQKRLVILLSHKNPLPAVTTRHDVIHRARVMEADRTNHPQDLPGSDR